MVEVIGQLIGRGEIKDSTIRSETSRMQPEDVHAEKRNIYEFIIPHFRQKYRVNNITVTGLSFGARGTISKSFVE